MNFVGVLRNLLYNVDASKLNIVVKSVNKRIGSIIVEHVQIHLRKITLNHSLFKNNILGERWLG